MDRIEAYRIDAFEAVPRLRQVKPGLLVCLLGKAGRGR